MKAKFLHHSLFIVITTLIINASMGRQFWGQAPQIWSGTTTTPPSSLSLFDLYTFLHILHGIILHPLTRYLIKRFSILTMTPLTLAMLIESLWEIIENTPIMVIHLQHNGQDYFGDSLINTYTDIATMTLGYWLATKYSWKKLALVCSVLLFIGFVVLENRMVEYLVGFFGI